MEKSHRLCCCDLLEKSYFCSITNIGDKNVSLIVVVVICLKNRTFAVSQTSTTEVLSWADELWFAWKIVLLQYHKHHMARTFSNRFSCDLLEKSYFCSITNISGSVLSRPWRVVICLKNRTFAVSQTSFYLLLPHFTLLWFAWKIVLLQYHKHLDKYTFISTLGCDLLEKSYFCSITNIFSIDLSLTSWVVICLKNRTFAVSQTSNALRGRLALLLWFAWKIVLLQYHKHLM